MLSTQTRAAITDHNPSLLNALRSRLRLGKTRPPPPSVTDNVTDHASSDLSSTDDGYIFDSESEDDADTHADLFVWDVPNPFDPPDPSMAHLQSLIQAEIAQMRRYESIGPLQSLPDQVRPLHDWSESESESDGEHEDSEDSEDSKDSEDYDDDGDDGDDEDSDDNDDDSDNNSDDDKDSDDDPDKPNVVVLPKLLHIPLRFLPSPPLPSRSPYSDTTTTDDGDPPALWADLAHVYNDAAEAEERAARKAKRDAHRSRLKVLAILGPEAASAI